MEFNVSKYNKFIVAIAGFVAVLAFAVQDGTLSDQEIGQVGSAAIAALAVFGVRNKTLSDITKDS